MDVGVTAGSRGPWINRGVRFVVLNIVVPIVLAWICVSLAQRLSKKPLSSDLREMPTAYGPVKLKLKLPGTSGRIPEPLFVYGSPGKAALVYIRLLANARAQVGVEFWGLGAIESEAFTLPSADAVIEVDCYLPVFFPRAGDPYWGNLSPELQAFRRSDYMIAVDGKIRLKGPVAYDQATHAPFYVGSNPIGGSLVSDRFTGSVISVVQPN